MKTFAQPRYNLWGNPHRRALPPRTSRRQPDLSGFSAGSQRVSSGWSAGAPDRHFCLRGGGLIRYEDFRADTPEPPRAPTSVSLGCRAGGTLSSACGQRAHCVRSACGRDRPFSPPPGGYAVHEDFFSASTSRFAPSAAGTQRAHSRRSRALSPDTRVGFCRCEDCFLASDVFSNRSTRTAARIAKVLGRRTEGAWKAEKEHGRWTEGALVRQRADANSEDDAELLQNDLRGRPEGGWKALGRYRRRSEGGRLRPSGQSHWG